MLIAAGVHGVVGDGVLRKIGRDQLPPDPFGGGRSDSKAVIRTTWHFGTIAFGVLGAWLLATGFQPDAAFAAGVTYFSGTLLSCYAVTGLAVSIYRRGLTGFYKHPGPIALSTAAILVWWGSTSL